MIKLAISKSLIRLGKKVSAGILDQVFSSLTNLFLSINFLRADKNTAISYSMIFLVYLLTLGISRSISSELIASGRKKSKEIDMEQLVFQLITLSTFSIFVGFIIVDTKHFEILTYLLLQPFGLCIDLTRQWKLASKKSETALKISAMQFLFVFLGTLFTVLFNSIVFLPFCWSITGIYLVTKYLKQYSYKIIKTHFSKNFMKLRFNSYSAEFMLSSGVNHLLILFFTLFAVPDLSLLYRLMTTVFAPWTTFHQGITISLIPYIRSSNLTAKKWTKSGLTIIFWISQMPFFGILYFADGEFLRLIVGDRWFLLQDYRIFVIFYYLMYVLASVPLLFIRGAALFKVGLAVRVAGSFSQISIPFILLICYGIKGFFIGLAIVQLIIAIVSLYQLKKNESALIINLDDY